jgi:hypothetical protein
MNRSPGTPVPISGTAPELARDPVYRARPIGVAAYVADPDSFRCTT